jgi:hypothetical protein
MGSFVTRTPVTLAMALGTVPCSPARFAPKGRLTCAPSFSGKENNLSHVRGA